MRVPFILLGIVLISMIMASSQPDVTIQLVSGAISGDVSNGLRVFRGIPYAAPPQGMQRWKPPQPVTPWDGVRDCTQFGPVCPQPPQALMRIMPGPQSEDCLYLNVWTPAKAPDKLPVMVWIHGGGCTTGAGSLPNYDGAALARQGVVVVTINYRLGPFGFFAHPQLTAESPRHVSGNYGFLDQIAALHWVRDNIAAFGGDPGCVTIFGESAGSASVVRLLVSPLAQGLFHRAIAESGGLGRTRALRAEGPLPSMEQVGESMAKTLGCTEMDPLGTLRAKNSDDILRAANPAQGLFGKGIKWGWVVDGWALPDDPAALYAAGKCADVPLLIGTNADEGSIFIPQLALNTVAAYRLKLKLFFGDEADNVFALFPAARDADVPTAVERLTTVFAFVADARAVARMKSRGQAKTYLYHFTRVTAYAKNRGVGAAHGLEIPYVFNNLPRFIRDPLDSKLAATMSAAWVSFAKTGDPNGPGLPAWPAYDAADRYLEFGDTVAVKSGLWKDACDLYDRIKAKQQAIAFDGDAL